MTVQVLGLGVGLAATGAAAVNDEAALVNGWTGLRADLVISVSQPNPIVELGRVVRGHFDAGPDAVAVDTALKKLLGVQTPLKVGDLCAHSNGTAISVACLRGGLAFERPSRFNVMGPQTGYGDQYLDESTIRWLVSAGTRVRWACLSGDFVSGLGSAAVRLFEVVKKSASAWSLGYPTAAVSSEAIAGIWSIYRELRRSNVTFERVRKGEIPGAGGILLENPHGLIDFENRHGIATYHRLLARWFRRGGDDGSGSGGGSEPGGGGPAPKVGGISLDLAVEAVVPELPALSKPELVGAIVTAAARAVHDPKGDLLARLVAELEISLADSPLSGARVERIEGVRAVSLRALLDRRGKATPVAADEPLSSEVNRIVGCAIDREHDDVLVLGAKVDARPPVMLVDVIDVLRSVYAEGVYPYVSLDPDFDGDRMTRIVPRVGGLPSTSLSARTLLDADYRMKSIVMGLGAERMEGLLNVPSASRIAPFEDFESRVDRYWLAPVQPAPNSIRVSRERDLAVFLADVQLRTEREDPALQGWKIAAVEPTRLAVEDFTRQFPRVCGRWPVFWRVQSIYEISMLATVLRAIASQNALLRQVCALTTSETDVASYPVLLAEVEYRFRSGLETRPLKGGVKGGAETSLVASATAYFATADPELAALRATVLGAVATGAPSGARPSVRLLHSPVDAERSRVEDLDDVDAGRRLLQDGKFVEAEAVLARASAERHDDPEVLLLSVLAAYRAGTLESTRVLALCKAAWDAAADRPDIRRSVAAVQAAVEAGAGDVRGAIATLEARLPLDSRGTDLLVALARLLLAADRGADAKSRVGEALRRDPTSADAWFVLAQISASEDQWAAARRFSSKGLLFQPADAEGRAISALAASFVDHWDIAESDARRALRGRALSRGGRVLAVSALARAQGFFGRWETADEFVQGQLKREERAAAWTTLADLASRQGQDARARAYVEAARRDSTALPARDEGR